MFSGRKSSGEDLAKRGFQPFNAAPATRDAGDADQNDGFVSLNQCKRDRRTIEDFAAKKDFGKPPLETQPAPSHAPIAKKRRPQSANGSEPMVSSITTFVPFPLRCRSSGGCAGNT